MLSSRMPKQWYSPTRNSWARLPVAVPQRLTARGFRATLVLASDSSYETKKANRTNANGKTLPNRDIVHFSRVSRPRQVSPTVPLHDMTVKDNTQSACNGPDSHVEWWSLNTSLRRMSR